MNVEIDEPMYGSALAESSKAHQPWKIGVRCLGITVLSLPAFGFAACVLYSLVYNFEGSTATHCRVQNYLPSASAAIGGFTPQRYIWRIAIALHCAPRFFYTALYHNYYKSQRIETHRGAYESLVKLTAASNVIEVFCLVLLTFVSSTENYDVHEKSFIAFVVFSLIHMLLTCILWSWPTAVQADMLKVTSSIRLKVLFFVLNLLSILFAGYFFSRHNSYCEPGIYTWFAVCEYSTILTNIAFHGTATIDFSDKYLTVATASSVVWQKTKPS